MGFGTEMVNGRRNKKSVANLNFEGESWVGDSRLWRELDGEIWVEGVLLSTNLELSPQNRILTKRTTPIIKIYLACSLVCSLWFTFCIIS